MAQAPAAGASSAGAPTKSATPAIIAGGVILALIAGGATLRGTQTSGTSAPVAVPTATPVRPGPTFAQIDGVLDGRKAGFTQAQQEQTWNSWAGTQITWSGEVKQVQTTDGGLITLKCNPATWGSDTVVKLDGTQAHELARINMGQRITFTGILESHGDSGYTINQGRVISLY